jgi:hypothetical protein
VRGACDARRVHRLCVRFFCEIMCALMCEIMFEIMCRIMCAIMCEIMCDIMCAAARGMMDSNIAATQAPPACATPIRSSQDAVLCVRDMDQQTRVEVRWRARSGGRPA